MQTKPKWIYRMAKIKKNIQSNPFLSKPICSDLKIVNGFICVDMYIYNTEAKTKYYNVSFLFGSSRTWTKWKMDITLMPRTNLKNQMINQNESYCKAHALNWKKKPFKSHLNGEKEYYSRKSFKPMRMLFVILQCAISSSSSQNLFEQKKKGELIGIR